MWVYLQKYFLFIFYLVLKTLTYIPSIFQSKWYVLFFIWGFLGDSVVKNTPAKAYPWVRKTPWRRKWQYTPVFLPGKSHGLATGHGVAKSQTWPSDWAHAHFLRLYMKCVYYHVRNESPVYVQCRIQHAWGWCMGMMRCYGEGGGRGVHVWERMYTHGGVMSMYGKTNTVL